MKFKPIALGLTAGIIWGAAVMFATWWIVIRGSAGETIGALSNFYLGYSVTWLGGLVGLVWGFIDGFICGAIFACLYNLFAGEKQE